MKNKINLILICCFSAFAMQDETSSAKKPNPSLIKRTHEEIECDERLKSYYSDQKTLFETFKRKGDNLLNNVMPRLILPEIQNCRVTPNPNLTAQRQNRIYALDYKMYYSRSSSVDLFVRDELKALNEIANSIFIFYQNDIDRQDQFSVEEMYTHEYKKIIINMKKIYSNLFNAFIKLKKDVAEECFSSIDSVHQNQVLSNLNNYIEHLLESQMLTTKWMESWKTIIAQNLLRTNEQFFMSVPLKYAAKPLVMRGWGKTINADFALEQDLVDSLKSCISDI